MLKTSLFVFLTFVVGLDIYLVLNQGYERDDRDRFQSAMTELAAKVGYTFRF